jgi:GAF domain-containing protein
VFRYVATRSLDPAFDAFLRARTFTAGRETLAGRVALTGDVVHIPDITTDPDYRLSEAATLGKLRRLLGVPLRRDGSVVGTLSPGARTGRAVYRAADRAGVHLCRSGRHCDRKHASVDRTARVAGAADRDG